jgi:cysteine-S-conjugate beta-lyase
MTQRDDPVTTQFPQVAALRRRTGVKWQAYGPEVLPAWVADMDFEIAPVIRRAIEDTIARSDLGYPPSYAHTGLAEIFCARMQARYHWQVAPAQVDFISRYSH